MIDLPDLILADVAPPLDYTPEAEVHAYEVLAQRFGFPAHYIKVLLEEHFESPSDAGWEHMSDSCEVQEQASTVVFDAWCLDDIRRFLASATEQEFEQYRAKREQERGIPGGVDDALDWYRAYVKLADMRNTDKQVPLTKDKKEDHYRKLIIDLYQISGYSIEDGVRIAYSPQGDELMRYLSDDKRHPLNRNREEELSPAI